MSRDPRQGAAIYEAMRAAAEASGGEAEAEVLARASLGVLVRRARGAPAETSSWREEAVAVRALLPEGGEGLAVAASWDDAAEAATRAVRLAERALPDAEPAVGPLLPLPRGVLEARTTSCPASPQSEEELLAALGVIERVALEQDARVVALDAGHVRSAVVESYLATTSGQALHQRHATAAAHAAVIARDGMNVAVRGDAWAGARLTPEEARALGRRLGRAGLVHLIGSGAAPLSPAAILLSASALAEICLPFMPVLLGLAPGAEGCVDLPPGLGLAEDSVDDAEARALPVDGAGRPLRRVAVIEGGTWTPPGMSALPRVRPGSGDAPRPGFLRATWSWAGGLPEDELLGELGTGLAIDTAQGIAWDPATLTWRGAVSGFWVEDGRRRHAVAGLPFAASLLDLLRGARAGGASPETAHASGSLRAVPLVIAMKRG